MTVRGITILCWNVGGQQKIIKVSEMILRYYEKSRFIIVWQKKKVIFDGIIVAKVPVILKWSVWYNFVIVKREVICENVVLLFCMLKKFVFVKRCVAFCFQIVG